MRVIFVHRNRLFDQHGGEQDQINNTRKALEALGVEVLVTHSLPADFGSYDLVHFFGLDDCHISEIEKARGVPKVMSPVFWDRAQGFSLDVEYEEWPRPEHCLRDKVWYWLYRTSPIRSMKVANIARIHFREILNKYAGFQSVIDEIDLFLPNSEAEMNAVRSFYVIEDCRYRMVPNAVNLHAIDDVSSDYAQRNLPSGPFVCCSGAIDRRKNQYALVKAMLDVDVPLVFAGSSRDRRYTEAVKRVAARRRDVYFLGHLDQPDLHSVYRAAKVHALPSFHDTPGISYLEAVAHKCVNVGTQIGGLREYLGEHSLYCNPFSVEHIRKQVLRALDMPPNLEGAKLVRSSYTYEKAAQATLEAYESVL